MNKITIKTNEEIKLMTEGGKILGEIRDKTASFLKPGMTAEEIDLFADKMISDSGGKASFKMVPGYKHATCINLNDVVVHGIPDKQTIKEGDKVGIDLGLFYKGWHTDTALTVIAGENKSNNFLDVGRSGLNKAISQAKPGKKIMDISRAMQETVEKAGYSVVTSLTGHGIGRELHEQPAIPCFAMGEYKNSLELIPGMVIAIEIMYNEGVSEVVYKNNDGWTIVTADGKISGLFEHTVAVTQSGPVILT